MPHSVTQHWVNFCIKKKKIPDKMPQMKWTFFKDYLQMFYYDRIYHHLHLKHKWNKFQSFPVIGLNVTWDYLVDKIVEYQAQSVQLKTQTDFQDRQKTSLESMTRFPTHFLTILINLPREWTSQNYLKNITSISENLKTHETWTKSQTITTSTWKI